MTNTPKKRLIESKFIKDMIKDTAGVVNELKITAGGIVCGFFDFLLDRYHKVENISIDFGGFDQREKLENIKNLLVNYREKSKHKYKKLHYTYIISRIYDRIHELESCNKLSELEKLFFAIQPGDIVLISYHSKGLNFDSILNTVANDALRYFSNSIFAHVGIIGNGNAHNGYDWIHSTLHHDGGRTGVKQLPLKEYLKDIKPCQLLVVRYEDISKKEQHLLLQEGLKNVQQKTKYDTRDAIGDITGFDFMRNEENFNCGELVYDCLNALDENLKIEKSALPASYLDNKKLEQIYLTFL